VDDELFGLAGRAFQIVDWDRTHQFCTRCGTPVTTSETERAKECPQCALIQYTRIAPSIIVLVQLGPELLLARPYHFPPCLYSVIAGFVEPGETFETASCRVDVVLLGGRGCQTVIPKEQDRDIGPQYYDNQLAYHEHEEMLQGEGGDDDVKQDLHAYQQG